MTKLIPLSRGLFATVDDDDFDSLNVYKWHVQRTRHYDYAARWIRQSDGKRILVRMHRLIAGALDGEDVDHIDHDGLNNRRSNIRRATEAQNAAHRRSKGNASGYRGVTRCSGHWRAHICVLFEQRNLGCFDRAEDAARAYDAGAIKAFGEFAILNFPGTPTAVVGRRHHVRSAPYRGLVWYKRYSCWVASIKVQGKNRTLGYFKVAEDAARAYDRAARQIQGEKAILNFPDEL